MLLTCLDVGGTFTDCVIHKWDRDSNEQVLSTGKVLSTGIVKGTVAAGNGRTLHSDLFGEDPSGFWNDFRLTFFDQQGSEFASRIVADHDRENCRVSLKEPFGCEIPVGTRFELQSDLEAPALVVRRLLGLPLSNQLPELDVRMGTTRGTNALLTRRGARTVLITTKGFADCLLIGDQDRPDLFALRVVKRQPLVERTIEVDERLSADGSVVRHLSADEVREKLRSLHSTGFESVAICLLHGWKNPIHEGLVAAIAREIGFREVSCSHEVAPMIRLVPRAETTVLNAYLNPVLQNYIVKVWGQLGGRDRCRLQLMTSAGDLTRADRLHGKDSVFSGPAGGTVALQAVARSHRHDQAIGIDMGGTSTDVSRVDGQLLRQYEGIKGGIRVLTPSLAIETVAAGGGSICGISGEQLTVGPQSAGADPGPACYGRGGPLTVTDLNLLLGRITPRGMPFPLQVEASKAALRLLHEKFLQSYAGAGQPLSQEELVEGYWRIANHVMAEAVRSITIREGIDPRPQLLVGFGGAAGQHLCAIAEILGMTQALDHADASVLSALGMGLAEVGQTSVQGVDEPLSRWPAERIRETLDALIAQNLLALREQANPSMAHPSFAHRMSVDLRYQGTNLAIEVSAEQCRHDRLMNLFEREHRRKFGYDRPGHSLDLVALRVTSTLPASYRLKEAVIPPNRIRTSQSKQRLYWNRQWLNVDLFHRCELQPGDRIIGPALIVGSQSTLVIDVSWSGTMASDHSIMLERNTDPPIEVEPTRRAAKRAGPLPTVSTILVEILTRRLQAIAEQMGGTLQRTAMSVNIKERRDFSCAVFLGDGSLVANAPHVPVHLGAMGNTVRHLIRNFPDLSPGDCFLTNDPFAGGSHLPDITVIQGVFPELGKGPAFFVANRAHHAEIGGRTPGSMPPFATKLYEEGVVLRDFWLVRGGVHRYEELLEHLRTACYPSRNPRENLADVQAQQAANQQGIRDLLELCAQYGTEVLQSAMEQLQSRAANAVVRAVIPSTLQFTDHLDDGTPITATLRRTGTRLQIDFTGTAGQHPYNFNATRGIVSAATIYTLRVLIDEEIPLNEGILRHVDLIIPPGLLDPPCPADFQEAPAVVAGNVETSQRIVDVLLGALGVCAASQGTMNNLLLGNDHFGYYETICGGSGATATGNGADAVHTHMTNTRITDPEVLETRIPVRLREFSIRRGSGGAGQFRGGDGIVREFEFLQPLTVSLISSRRGPYPPYGLHGGSPGQLGCNWRIGIDGTKERLPGCVQFVAAPGERLRIETPGGGGWGVPSGGRVAE